MGGQLSKTCPVGLLVMHDFKFALLIVRALKYKYKYMTY